MGRQMRLAKQELDLLRAGNGASISHSVRAETATVAEVEDEIGMGLEAAVSQPVPVDEGSARRVAVREDLRVQRAIARPVDVGLGKREVHRDCRDREDSNGNSEEQVHRDHDTITVKPGLSAGFRLNEGSVVFVFTATQQMDPERPG